MKNENSSEWGFFVDIENFDKNCNEIVDKKNSKIVDKKTYIIIINDDNYITVNNSKKCNYSDFFCFFKIIFQIIILTTMNYIIFYKL